MSEKLIKQSIKKYWALIYVAFIPFLFLASSSSPVSRIIYNNLPAGGFRLSQFQIQLALLVIYFLAWLISVKAIEQYALLTCQYCKKQITRNNYRSILKTECCTHCGKKVVNEQP